jgi:hypothetical protein
MPFVSGTAELAAALNAVLRAALVPAPADGWPADAGLSARRAFATACFLTLPTVTREVTCLGFAERTLPRLLASLTRRIERQRVIFRGVISGRPRWHATWKAQLRAGSDSSLTVCERTRRVLDTPENRLARFLTRALLEASRGLPGELGAGWVIWPAADQPSLPSRASDVLGRLLRPLSAAERHPWFRHVPLAPAIDPPLLARVEANRYPDYRGLARLYRRQRHAAQALDWAQVSQDARRAFPIPATAGPPGVWARIAASFLRSPAGALWWHGTT